MKGGGAGWMKVRGSRQAVGWECRKTWGNICLWLSYPKLSHAQVEPVNVIAKHDSGDAKVHIKHFPLLLSIEGTRGSGMSQWASGGPIPRLYHHSFVSRLTLSARWTFPAFFANTSERVPADYASSTVEARIWQTAAVSCYERKKM